jgi:hypothetical protein
VREGNERRRCRRGKHQSVCSSRRSASASRGEKEAEEETHGEVEGVGQPLLFGLGGTVGALESILLTGNTNGKSCQRGSEVGRAVDGRVDGGRGSRTVVVARRRHRRGRNHDWRDGRDWISTSSGSSTQTSGRSESWEKSELGEGRGRRRRQGRERTKGGKGRVYRSGNEVVQTTTGLIPETTQTRTRRVESWRRTS